MKKADTPDTLYECPICQKPITLRKMTRHLNVHIRYDPYVITLDNEEYVYGAHWVAEKVLKSNGMSTVKLRDYVIETPWISHAMQDHGYGPNKVICPICGGDGGAAGQCYKCGGTGWA